MAEEAQLQSISIDQAGELAYRHVEYLSETIGQRVVQILKKPNQNASEPSGEEQALDYIENVLEDFYSVEVQPFTTELRDKNDKVTGYVKSANVIAVKPGLSEKEIIVGAAGSKGADDNASGVAIMLEAAERLANIDTPYTIKFVAFGAEEIGLEGSSYYVSQMSEEEIANTVAMINLDSCLVGDNMYVYGGEGEEGFVRELALSIATELELNLQTNPGLNPEYPAGTTGDWSDHAPFKNVGIPYGYFEATNWELGELDGYTQVDVEFGVNEEVWHTKYDNLEYKSLGNTVEGRDAHFVILAEDKESIDEYLNGTIEEMTESPGKLQKKLENGSHKDYKVPIWFNNIHPDEAPGPDAIFELLEEFATKDTITYKLYGSTDVPTGDEGWTSNLEDPSQEETITIDVMNQLEYFKRGIEGIDSEEVDQFMMNAAGEVIGRPRNDNENFFPEYYVLPVDENLQKNALEAYKIVEYLLRNGADEVLYDSQGAFISSMPEGAEVLTWVSNEDNYLKAGWWSGNEVVRGRTLAISAKVGNSDITLFANNIVNKAHPQKEWRMLANAIFVSNLEE
ncbi:MAG: M20/M25/M40 family metallo-hydrolase [Clostridia bacterium]